MTLFAGMAPAVICPMQADGQVDYDAFARLIVKLTAEGAAALVVNGTTGEASTLTSEEKMKLVAIAKEKSHLPVIAGAGSNDTSAAVKNALNAKKAGADALLLVTPYYNKASQKGLIAHFETIAGAAKLPCILYTVPGRTGMNILPETCEVLAKNPYIVGLKDAVGNLTYTMDVLEKTKGEDFTVYSGEDRLTLAMMALGGKGVISVTGNVYPKQVSALCQAMLEGDLQTAQKWQFALDDFTKLMFADVNPIPVKYACHKQGFGENILRLPLISCDEALMAKIDACMKELEA